MDDVTDVLRTLKKSSPGPDGIPGWVYRDHRNVLARAIHHVCSRSVATGIVPAPLKLGFVTPIPKISNPSINDYRPISILSVISKILEKLVLRKWLYQLAPRLGSQQFAFLPRSGQGTISALTFLMHKILSFLDTPGVVRLLMIDFSKAFDRLPHNIILNKMISLGAPQELVRWTSSFLSSRFQCVKHKN